MDLTISLAEAARDFLAAISDVLEPEIMLAAGIGALAGIVRARLLLAACLAGGVLGGWMMLTGNDLYIQYPEIMIGITVLTAIGFMESMVVIVGGREAAPQFWGAVFVALIAFFLLFPLRAAGRIGRIMPGTGIVRTLFRSTRH